MTYDQRDDFKVVLLCIYEVTGFGTSIQVKASVVVALQLNTTKEYVLVHLA